MTGLWQVSGRSELDFDDLVRLGPCLTAVIDPLNRALKFCHLPTRFPAEKVGVR